MADIILHAVTWSTDTAGPSPDKNNRTEIFFRGCGRAMEGNPCKGCFNRELWYNSTEDNRYSVDDIVSKIEQYAPNKYITIGGGEPSDQMEGLLELTATLKHLGYHIMVYTWKDLEQMLMQEETKEDFLSLLTYVDILVDGEFKLEERLYQPAAADGFYSSIGSGNQTIWSTQSFDMDITNAIKGYRMADVLALKLDTNDGLHYHLIKSGDYSPRIIDIKE